MRRVCVTLCLCFAVGLVSVAQADLVVVDNLQTATSGASVDNRVCPGTLGGTWDTEGDGTSNMKVQADGENKYLAAQGRSDGSDRGAGITGITNPITNTETGVAFFRFRVLNETKPVQTYYGIHDNASTNFLVDPAVPSQINAGFVVYREATSGNIQIRTINAATTLKSDIVPGSWYNAWIAANNATNTFDLYVNAVTGPGGDAELPAGTDRIGSSLPFSTATDNNLVGIMLCTRNAGGSPQIAENSVDDFWWDGDQGLTNIIAWNPDPMNGEGLTGMGVAINKVLSWSAPDDPNIVITETEYPEYAVYMDPNQTKVATGIGCQYTRSMDPAASFDPVPDMAYETQYYWRVETQVRFDYRQDPNTFKGDIWTFKTRALNTSPVANAGSSIVTWLAMAQAGIDLATRTTPAAETDVENDATVTWAAFKSNYGLPDSDVSFDNASLVNPIVTITSTGSHFLKMSSQDSENPASVSWMQIDVYADACEAAKNSPDGYTQHAYDYNNNCIVDMADLAIFAAQWLNDDKLATQNKEYPGGGDDLLLWLDASDASTLTLDGSNKVTQWNDKAGSGVRLIPGAAGSEPTYVAGALNGKGIVDFGAAVADATGKWMQWKEEDGDNFSPVGIRTVFWVMKGGNSLLGDNTTYDFHRGFNNVDPNSIIWHSGNTDADIRNGQTYLNGILIDGTVTNLPTNYSLVSLVTAGGVEASRLCSDRNLRTGGQQIAEIIVFNRALSDAERQAIEADLKAKWGTP